MYLLSQLIRQWQEDSLGDVVATLISMEMEMKMTRKLHIWDTTFQGSGLRRGLGNAGKICRFF